MRDSFEGKDKSYFELLGTLYLLIDKIRRESVFSIEDDIDKPSDSQIFNAISKYDDLDKTVYTFVRDVFRLISNGMHDPYVLERYMDAYINTTKTDEKQASLLECTRLSIIVHLDGFNPAWCAEFGRQGILAEHKPSYQELDEFIRHLNKMTAPTRESVNAMLENIFSPQVAENNSQASN